MFRKVALFALMLPLALVCAAFQNVPYYGPNSFPQGITINGVKLSNAPTMTWAPAGTVTYASTGRNGTFWTPTAPITFTRLNASVSTAVTGCTTYPILGIFDATSSTWVATLTMTSGAFTFSSNETGTAAAGDSLQAGIQTAGVGCTGTSGNVWFTATYIMQ
jgi:hypothetical protein